MEICRECGGKIKVIKNKPYKYDECGLDVIIIGLNQYECKKCKELFVEIPRINELHRVLGGILCKEKKGLLEANEIKFLRKDLHLQSKDFAKILGISPSTVSRWKSGLTKRARSSCSCTGSPEPIPSGRWPTFGS